MLQKMWCHFWSLCCPQVDKLEEEESQRKTEEEVTEPQPIVFGKWHRLQADTLLWNVKYEDFSINLSINHPIYKMKWQVSCCSILLNISAGFSLMSPSKMNVIPHNARLTILCLFLNLILKNMKSEFCSRGSYSDSHWNIVGGSNASKHWMSPPTVKYEK